MNTATKRINTANWLTDDSEPPLDVRVTNYGKGRYVAEVVGGIVYQSSDNGKTWSRWEGQG